MDPKPDDQELTDLKFVHNVYIPIREEDIITPQQKLFRLVNIMADKMDWACDNAGGEPRPNCHCDSCEGWRLIQSLFP